MTRNDIINNFNVQLLTFMMNEFFISYNIDILINERNIEIYIIKYFNIINFSILFSYKLNLKINIFIILLRNLSQFIELYNEIHL